MFTSWNDLDRTFAAFDELRRRLETPMFRSFGQLGAGGSWPRVFVEDTGNALLVTADVPGLSHKDIDLELDKGTLKISGERKVSAPEGYAVHRQERGSMKFSRSFTLPALIDPEKVSATVKDGVLTVNLEKSAAAKPRQIAVKSA